MFLDTRPAGLGDEGDEDPLREFRVSEESEIIHLLKQLRDAAVTVNLVGPHGVALNSSVWSVDPDQGRLTFSADDANPQVHKLLSANETTAVGYLESVKLQFEVHHMVLVRGAQTSALQASLPLHMYRFQRRNGYRVKPLERSSPSVQFMHPALPDKKLALRVMDVSIGGCALMLPHNVQGFPDETQIEQARVDLDADTRFNVGLLMHHASPVRASDGALLGSRLGCEWIKIDGGAQRALQRYIDQIQKRRRLMTLR